MQYKRPYRTFLDETAYALISTRLAWELKCWVELAIFSLAVAGLLAFIAVIARTPGLQKLLPWPWQDFFHKVVITHVDLSIIVWLLSILGVLVVLATARVVTNGKPRLSSLGPFSLALTTIGSVMLVIPTLFNLGEASLNNYVPVLVHPIFYAGLTGVALGIAAVVVRLLCSITWYVTGPFEHGVAATGATFLIALICFGLAWVALPSGVETELTNERLFWGGGHILQFVNTMLMLVTWQILSRQTISREAIVMIPPHLFTVAVWTMTTVAMSGMFIYVAFDVLSREHREAFTQLLQYGLVLPPAVITIVILMRLVRNRQWIVWGELSTLSLLLSQLLFTVGGMLGYFLGVGDTRTPSHYHAVIGGVNLAVMGVTFTLFLPLLQRSWLTTRLVTWSLSLYGGGQLAFSVGMFAAGIMGVPRKTAGMEQGIDTVAKYIYMSLYGTGGLIAIIGGTLFVWIAVKCLLLQQVYNNERI